MRSCRSALAALAGRYLVVAALAFAAACTTENAPTGPSGDAASLAHGGVQGPDFRAANAAKEKHAERLLAREGVEGLGVSLTSDGRPSIRIFTRHGAVGGLPRSLDGIPVEVEVTGRIEAILPRAKPGGSGGANPTSRFTRPVPIGISIGNANECSAGTLGARVTGGGKTYILSNNHVLARENDASTGEDILQPGRYDTNCSASADDVVADLSQAVNISFGGNNEVDAAIAEVRSGAVGNATTSRGYGVPDSDPVAAFVGQPVQKCGRTTSCTQGTVSAINATINVQYSSGVARFVNQIVISGRRGSFSRAGDSGSLIVTDNAAANPVALLFAGSNTTTIGNPISVVLQRLGVAIDGK